MSDTTDNIGVSLAVFGVVTAVMTRMIRKHDSTLDDVSRGAGVGNDDEQHFFFSAEEQELEQFVQSIPKIELHVHLDGSFDPYQLWDYLCKHPQIIESFPVEKAMPWAKTDEPPMRLRERVEACRNGLAYRRLSTCRRRFRNSRHPDAKFEDSHQGTLEDMLNCFEYIFPMVYENEILLEELAYDFVKRQYEQNIIYTEVRFSPHLFSKDHVKAFNAVTNGLRRGCQSFPNIIFNQILCAICFYPNWANDILDMANKHRNDYPCAVVGVDVAAGEAHFEKDSPYWKDHYEMCQRAQELGLNITIHAGETPNTTDHVPLAIQEYGAKRIGHGYQIAHREDLMTLVRDKKVHIESCPTSSVETGSWTKEHWKNHPTVAFHEFGVPLSLSSDDPAVFNTSLTWQYRIALKKMGFSKQDIFTMLDQAIEASFQDQTGKDALREKIASWKIHDNHAFNDRVHYD